MIPWLRALRLGKEEARRAAEAVCTEFPDASLEKKVSRALGYLARSRPVPAPRVAAVG